MKANISISPAASLVHEDVEIVVDDLEYSTIHKLELRYLGVRFGGYFNCTPPVDLEYYLIVTDPRERKVCEKMFRRRLMYPTVQRIEVEESFPPDAGARPKVTGTIFKPPGTGPFPTIIDISGTGGGLNEQKRAALDSRGFVVLCLAFFKYKSLPEDLLTVELQYFEDAINYITSLPYTRDRIVFQGVSFGGTLVMFLTTKFPKRTPPISILDSRQTLLDPPCFPHHPMVYSNIAGLFQTYGGDTSLHGKSEFEVWERTVRFFSEHLGAPTPLPDYLRHSAKL